ncbi:hypothetical protein [Maricaulis sp.]|uniref:hypothetical protein n=1 Tax=Maricaulis sp. TaxID=1486257 RepID=UPI003A8F74DB
MANDGKKEITHKGRQIKVLAPNSAPKEITPDQGILDLGIQADADIGGIGMGVLSDGTPYLNQRGLAVLCGVENAHIGYISAQWNDKSPKPRIKAIKSILKDAGASSSVSHYSLPYKGISHFCYPAEVSLAILEYYAFDAGANCQPEARANFRKLAGSKLRDMIYSYVGYDPTGRYQDRFAKWHERIALNYQSAPKGYFHVFNEAHTIIYELIQSGADIGEKFVIDISIGQHWSRHWDEFSYDAVYGKRRKYPHKYPDSHPQSKSNPQESWCYPVSALGVFREWLQNEYIEGGKFTTYLKGKVKRGELPPSIANLQIGAVS